MTVTTAAAAGATTAAYPEDGSVRPVHRYCWVPTETPRPVGLSPALRGRRIAVVGGGAAAAAALAAALTAAGAEAYRVAPPADEDTVLPAPLAELLRRDGGAFDGIIDLNVAEPVGSAGPSGWEAPLRQSLALLQACYESWSGESDAVRRFYVAVTRLGGQMGFADSDVAQPLGGLWAGLAKGLPRELPACNVKVVDLAPEDEPHLAELVCRELYRWGLIEVGYRGGRRYTLVARPVPVGPPRLDLRQGDVVVMSGGGRGIGFALARSLAADFGATVVVSGRRDFPAPSQPGIRLGAAEFRAYRADRLRAAAAGAGVAAVRAELDRLARDRELWSNVTGAHAQGLDVQYVRCDVTSRPDVDRLLDVAGERLVGIVHDAGVDVPVRLPAKTWPVARGVVEAKVAGFLNLLAAAEGRGELAFFCSVGSLTGRWGGMVGQLDYGAANEGLSRLGLWAAQPGPQRGRRSRVPVTTLCWPTWERLGMVTNYEATLQYMSAVDVTEGLFHWQRELLAGQPGEVTYLGEVGVAMVPALLRGYPHWSSLPGNERLVSQRFFLGRPSRFHVHESLTTEHALSGDLLPCATDVRVAGRPALPVSLCVEVLASAGAWVLPRESGRLRLHELRSVEIDVAALALDPGPEPTRLVRTAAGRWVGRCWHVSVALRRRGGEVACAELVYRPDAATDADRLDVDRLARDPSEALDVGTPGRLVRWRGQAFRFPRWRLHLPSRSWYASVEADRAGDLIAAWPTPTSALGLNVAENAVRAGFLRTVDPGAGRPGLLRIDRLVPRRPATGGGWLVGGADGADWTSYDHRGEAQLRIEGLHFLDPPGGPLRPGTTPDRRDTQR